MNRFHTRNSKNSTVAALIYAVAIAMIFPATPPVFAQWQPVNLPAGFAGGYYLDVFFLPSNPQLGWICGMDSRVMRTTDGGNTWRGTTITELNGEMLESVHFVSPNVGFTSGPGGIFRSSNGGASWVNITPPNTNITFWGCYFLNAFTGMVLGGVCTGQQHFYRTTDGGNTWRVFLGSEGDTKLSDAILYAENGRGYASSSGLVWRTDDGGRTWFVIGRTGTHVWQEEITNNGSSILVPASGSTCDGNERSIGEMRFSTDEGATWKRFNTGASMFGAFLSSPTTGWGTGDGGRVVRTIDAGTTWYNANCGIAPNHNIDDIWFINDTTGWCVGQGVYRYVPSEPNPVSVQTSKPPRFCAGDSVIITAADGFAAYSWSTGETTRSIVARTSGVYRVTAYNNNTCRFSTDSVAVVVLPPVAPVLQINRPIPALCKPGDSVVITASPGFVSYRWSTGQTGRAITVKTEGSYSVTVVDSNGCEGVSPPVVVKKSDPFTPKITLNRAPTFCHGDSLLLSAEPGFAEYLWNTGETTRSIIVKKAGAYRVTVRDANGCDGASDSVTITVLDIRNRIGIVKAAPGETEISFDSTMLGLMLCQLVTLQNRDTVAAITITQPYLTQNIRFSLKHSELPLVIPPSGSVRLTVCFAPVDTGVVRDTLVIPDTCSPNLIPLHGTGTAVPVRGKALCDLPVGGSIIALGKNFRATAPFPNPAEDEFAVTFITPEAVTPVSAQFLNILGLPAGKIALKTEASSPSGIAGEVRVSVGGLPSGTYILTIFAGGEALALPVIVK